MTSRNLMGFAIAALSVLATVWLYNRFSGKSIATLGAKTTAAVSS